MSFFANTFFEKPFFKEPFFGEVFFQEPFFDDTTIAHGLTAGTTSAVEITMITNRTISGTIDIADIAVVVDGTQHPTVSGVGTGKDFVITVTGAIAALQSIVLHIKANPLNNLGVIDGDTVVNNMVQIMLRPELWDELKPAPKPKKRKKKAD